MSLWRSFIKLLLFLLLAQSTHSFSWKSLTSSVSDAVTDVVDTVTDSVENAFDDAADALSSLEKDLTTIINDVISDIVETFDDAIDLITNDIVPDLGQMFGALGLINGLSDLDKAVFAGLSTLNTDTLLKNVEKLSDITQDAWDNMDLPSQLSICSLPSTVQGYLTKGLDYLEDMFDDLIPFPLDVIDEDVDTIDIMKCVEGNFYELLIGFVTDIGDSLTKLGTDYANIYTVFQLDSEIEEFFEGSQTCISTIANRLKQKSSSFDSIINGFDYSDDWSIGIGLSIAVCYAFTCVNVNVQWVTEVNGTDWDIYLSLGPSASSSSDANGVTLSTFVSFNTKYDLSGHMLVLGISDVGLNIGDYFSIDLPDASVAIDPESGDIISIIFPMDLTTSTDNVDTFSSGLISYYDKLDNIASKILSSVSGSISFGYYYAIEIETDDLASYFRRRRLASSGNLQYGALYSSARANSSSINASCPYYESDDIYVISSLTLHTALAVNQTATLTTLACDFTGDALEKCENVPKPQCSFYDLTEICDSNPTLTRDHTLAILYECSVYKLWNLGCFNISQSDIKSFVYSVDGEYYPINGSHPELSCAALAYEKNYNGFALWTESVRYSFGGIQKATTYCLIHNNKLIDVDFLLKNTNESSECANSNTGDNTTIHAYYFNNDLYYENFGCVNEQYFNLSKYNISQIQEDDLNVNKLKSFEYKHVLLLNNYKNRNNALLKCAQVAYDEGYTYFALWNQSCWLSNYWSYKKLLSLVNSSNLTTCVNETGTATSIAFYEMHSYEVDSGESNASSSLSSSEILGISLGVIISLLCIGIIIGTVYYFKKSNKQIPSFNIQLFSKNKTTSATTARPKTEQPKKGHVQNMVRHIQSTESATTANATTTTTPKPSVQNMVQRFQSTETAPSTLNTPKPYSTTTLSPNVPPSPKSAAPTIVPKAPTVVPKASTVAPTPPPTFPKVPVPPSPSPQAAVPPSPKAAVSPKAPVVTPKPYRRY